jgi:hypothetical protein
VPARGENFHPLGFCSGLAGAAKCARCFPGRPLYIFPSAAILLCIPGRMGEVGGTVDGN